MHLLRAETIDWLTRSHLRPFSKKVSKFDRARILRACHGARTPATVRVGTKHGKLSLPPPQARPPPIRRAYRTRPAGSIPSAALYSPSSPMRGRLVVLAFAAPWRRNGCMSQGTCPNSQVALSGPMRGRLGARAFAAPWRRAGCLSQGTCPNHQVAHRIVRRLRVPGPSRRTVRRRPHTRPSRRTVTTNAARAPRSCAAARPSSRRSPPPTCTSPAKPPPAAATAAPRGSARART